MRAGTLWRRLRWPVVLGCAAILAGCGFQLRGAANFPFDTIHIPTVNPTLVELARNVRATGNAKVVDDPKSAEAVFAVLGETREKLILSLNTAGRVREFQLILRFMFRVHDGKGGEYVPASEILLKRDITFNDQLIAKENEEVVLYREMQSDLVQQVLRRLQAAKLRRPGEDT